MDDLLVVVGSHDGASIKASMGPFGFSVRVVENPDYPKGQLSSLQAGLRAADRPESAACSSRSSTSRSSRAVQSVLSSTRTAGIRTWLSSDRSTGIGTATRSCSIASCSTTFVLAIQRSEQSPS